MAADSTAELDGSDFDRLVAVHRGAARGYWVYAVTLVAFGIALVGLAFFQQLPWLIGLVVGLLACALAVLPAGQAVERGERIEGLVVLRDEWQELKRDGEITEDERARFFDLMRRLYSGQRKQD